MKKETIIVPKGVRYLGDWVGFQLPPIPHIMNKVVTGCGFTEYFLRPNPSYPKVILVSPRRVLLENKESQHNHPLDGVDIGEVYYARNDLETVSGYDTDLTRDPTSKEAKKSSPKPLSPKDLEERKKKVEELKQKLLEYVLRCQITGQDIRIMSTYDSFRHVKETLGDQIDQYQIVVDEFQSIFTDSKFKSDTELELLYHLQGLPHICFLSATPMLDEYLERLDEFKDLPYYQLDWEKEQPGRVRVPNLDCKQVKSIVTAAKEEIDKYLRGEFERFSWRDENGNIQEVYSKEICLFENSVRNICENIKRSNLHPDQCNILCANTEDNNKKIRAAFKAANPGIKFPNKTNFIGSVPQKGEPHKMFTFCTRTVYLGADFYSTCARTLILSDANIDSLSVDISMDLPQILGRQRLTDINPWANSAMFRFKTNTKSMTQEEFDAFIAEKIDATNDLLQGYKDGSTPAVKHRLALNFEYVAKQKKYRDDYVAVNHHMGADLKPVFNNLILVAEQRTFDIQKIDYKDRFSVLAEVDNSSALDERSQIINEFLQHFNLLGEGREKMKFLCEFLVDKPELEAEILFNVPLAFKNYYTVLGPKRCWSFSYTMSRLEKEYQKQKTNQGVNSVQLRKTIYSSFKEGERYSKADLKKAVQGIYDHLGLLKTGKAADFEEWFEMKRCTILDPVTKKRQEGFELVKKKFPDISPKPLI